MCAFKAPPPSPKVCESHFIAAEATSELYPPPLYPTPLTPSSLAWDKRRNHSRGAVHPLSSTMIPAPPRLPGTFAL